MNVLNEFEAKDKDLVKSLNLHLLFLHLFFSVSTFEDLIGAEIDITLFPKNSTPSPLLRQLNDDAITSLEKIPECFIK